MKVLHRHVAPPVSTAVDKPARSDAPRIKHADTFSLQRSRQVVRHWLRLPEPAQKPITMDAATGAAIGGATCLAVICSPVITVLGILCLPCIGCCAGAALMD